MTLFKCFYSCISAVDDLRYHTFYLSLHIITLDIRTHYFHLSIFIYDLSINQSINQSIYLSFYLSIYLSINQSINLSTYLFIHLSVYHILLMCSPLLIDLYVDLLYPKAFKLSKCSRLHYPITFEFRSCFTNRKYQNKKK